jgi:phosphate transport system protein
MTISPDDLGEVMIQRHFDEELSDLKTKLLRMAGQVEDQIDQALTALVTRDSALARQVIERDHLVNSLDLEIDEESIRLLALHQPAARDLRLVTTAMKIATELERISDLAENVCERAIELNEEPQLKPYIDIPMMGNMARMMVKQSIDAFVKDDAMLARKVLTDDDFVDDLMEQLFRELLSFMLEDTRTISRAIRLSFIAKYLERMADHATNIAELVVYLVEGKNIRHITPPGSSTNSLAES